MNFALNRFSPKFVLQIGVQATAFYFAYIIYQSIGGVGLSLNMNFWQFRDLFVYWSLSIVVVHSAVCGMTNETKFWAFFILGMIALEGEIWSYVMSKISHWSQFLFLPVLLNLFVYSIYKFFPVIAYFTGKLFFKLGSIETFRNLLFDASEVLRKNSATKSTLSHWLRKSSEYSLSSEVGSFIVEMGRPSFLRLNITRIQKYFLAFEIFWAVVILAYYAVFGDLDGNLTAQWEAQGHPDLYVLSFLFSDIIGVYFVYMLVVNMYREKSGIGQLSLTESEEELLEREYREMVSNHKNKYPE